jgi:3-ketoacyl-CoA synthase
MGCSANVVSVDLAKELLQNRPGTIALVISTENLTQNLYLGNEKSMLLQNTLFRAGGTALLLSSRRVDGLRAKYKLLFTFRSQMADDNSYRCVFEQEDENGNSGVALSKDIVTVAGQAMRHNFVVLAPYILPLREQARTVFNRVLIQLAALLKRHGWPHADPPKPYMPDFTQGIDHFCIHAGGRAVIEGVQKNLGLQERHVQPSKQTLYDWGNTSSSSIWYEAEWIERFGSLRRGDRILQIAFGSGFKCNSAVWVALRVDNTKVGVPLKRGRLAQDLDTADMADKAL